MARQHSIQTYNQDGTLVREEFVDWTRDDYLKEIKRVEQKRTIRLIGDLADDPTKVFDASTGQTVKQKYDEIETELDLLREEMKGV